MLRALDRLLGPAPARPPLSRGQRARAGASTLALIAVLLAYANGDAWRFARRGRTLSPETNCTHLAMLGGVLLWALADRLSARELGLGRHHLGRGLLWGAVVGLLGALPIAVFFKFPLFGRQAVTHPDYVGISRARLAWLVTGQFLLGSAVFEEIAFRGVLHAKLLRLLSPAWALLVGSGVFAAWHIVITWYNLRRSNLPRGLFPLLYAGALTALFGGGLLFGLVRQLGGHVGGAVLAHWLMVAAIVVSVARPARVKDG